MRIGFITSKQSNRQSQLSGAPYYMEKALEKYCGQVFFIPPGRLSLAARFVGRWINLISKTITGKNYAYNHTILEAYLAGIHFTKTARELRLDAIFATRAATQIAFLKTNIPIIYTSDTTFKLMEGYYGYWSRLNKISLTEGNYIEKLAIQNSAQIFYPSSWPLRSATQDYKAASKQLSVIKSGANFDSIDIPSLDQISSLRNLSSCHLLFIGVDWERKGGLIAVEALKHLLAANIPAKLTIVGCEPPSNLLNKRIMVIKKLNKSIPEEKKQLIRLYQQANFFLLPTRADTSGLVFSEASALGLPIITSDTGGVTSIVKQGINGYVLAYQDNGISYARRIKQLYTDQTRYKKLVQTTRQEYEKTLNWNTWGKNVHQLICKTLMKGDLQ